MRKVTLRGIISNFDHILDLGRKGGILISMAQTGEGGEVARRRLGTGGVIKEVKLRPERPDPGPIESKLPEPAKIPGWYT